MTDVMTAIRERRSVSTVTGAPVARAVLERMLEAALWAPNHKVTEPWRFVVMQGDALDALGDAHAAAVARAKPGLTEEARLAQRALTRRAPVIVAVICAATSDDPVVRREDRDAVAAAVQNMLLVAHEAGLGAIWRTGAFCDEPEVRAYLGCGDADEIVAFVYVGVPSGAVVPAPERRPLDGLVDWRD